VQQRQRALTILVRFVHFYGAEPQDRTAVMSIFGRKKNKREGLGLGIADHGRSPLRANEQKSPQQERTTRPDEEAGQAVHQMKNPPKAEG
jgi:hypothetical protein